MNSSSKIIILLIILATFFITPVYYIYNFIHSPAIPNQDKAVFYEVKKAESPIKIAKDLEELKVIRNATLFYWYGKITGKNQKIKAGDYRFTTKMNPEEVFTILMSGLSYGLPLTIPEGYNIYQIAKAFSQIKKNNESETKFIKLTHSLEFIQNIAQPILGFIPPSHNLEGYLYPDTYQITKSTQEEDLIKTMLLKYRSVVTENLIEKAQSMGFSEHALITLASMIEKETGAKQERALISSVFHNRLKKKMRLQSDPTVIYGLEPHFNGNLTKADLLKYTPYNTYKIFGLPIGPIANPGIDSIMAALNPESTNYFYFVSHNDGTHEFTENYENHQTAVKKYQLDKKAREGRSWRDLKNKN
jgi:UPF0755 protein